MDERTERKIAANEARLRSMNERTVDAEQDFRDDGGEQHEIMCECARTDCETMLHVDLATFERIRSNPIRFFVVPGHEMPEVEVVVETHDEWLVVEKQRAGAEEARERA